MAAEAHEDKMADMIQSDKMAGKIQIDKMVENSSSSITSTSEIELSSTGKEKPRIILRIRTGSKNTKLIYKTPQITETNQRIYDKNQNITVRKSTVTDTRQEATKKGKIDVGNSKRNGRGSGKERNGFQLVSAQYGFPVAYKINGRRMWPKKIALAKPIFRKAEDIACTFDPRRIRRLMDDCLKQLQSIIPVFDGDNVEKNYDKTRLEEAVTIVTRTETGETEGKKSGKYSVNAPTADTEGESIVSSSNTSPSPKQWDRRYSANIDEGIASSSSSPSASPAYLRDRTNLELSKPIRAVHHKSPSLRTPGLIKKSVKLKGQSRSSLDPSYVETSPSRSRSPVANNARSSKSQGNPPYSDCSKSRFIKGANLKTVLFGDDSDPPSRVSSKSPSKMEKSKDCDDRKKLLDILDSPESDKSLNSSMSRPSDRHHKDVRSSAKHLGSHENSKKHSSHNSHISRTSHKSHSSRSSHKSHNSHSSLSSRSSHNHHKSRSVSRHHSTDSRKRSYSRERSPRCERPRKPEVSSSSSKKRAHSRENRRSEHSSKRHRKISSSSSISSKSSSSVSSEKSTKRKVSESKDDCNKKPAHIGNFKKQRVLNVSTDSHSESSASEFLEIKTEKLEKESQDVDHNLIDLFRDYERFTSEECQSSKENSPQMLKVPESDKSDDSESIPKNCEMTEEENDKDVDPVQRLAQIPEELETPCPREKPSSGTGNYLKRSLLKLRKERENLSKDPLAEAPKPASAFRPRSKVLLPLKPLVAPPASTDASQINARVPIDEHIFKELEDEPVPLIPAVEKQLEAQVKAKVPLMVKVDTSDVGPSKASELTDPDELSVHSPHSVATVILDENSMSPGALQIDEDAKTPLQEDIHHVEKADDTLNSHPVPNAEGIQMVQTREIPSGPDTEQTQNSNGENLDKSPEKLSTQLLRIGTNSRPRKPQNPQKLIPPTPKEIEDISKRFTSQISSTNHKSTVMPTIIGPPATDLLITPRRASPECIRQECRDKGGLFQNMIQNIHVYRFRRSRLEHDPRDMMLNNYLNEICRIIRGKMDWLKKVSDETSDEEMTRLIVEYSRTMGLKYAVTDEELKAALRSVRIAVVDPVPKPVLPMVEPMSAASNSSCTELPIKLKDKYRRPKQISGSRRRKTKEGDNENPSIGLSKTGPPPPYPSPPKVVQENNPHDISQTPLSSERQVLQPTIPRPMPQFNQEISVTTGQSTSPSITITSQISEMSPTVSQPSDNPPLSANPPEPAPPPPTPQQPPPLAPQQPPPPTPQQPAPTTPQQPPPTTPQQPPPPTPQQLPPPTNSESEFHQNTQLQNQQVSVVQSNSIVNVNIQPTPPVSTANYGYNSQCNEQLKLQQQMMAQQQFITHQQMLFQSQRLSMGRQTMMNQFSASGYPEIPLEFQICITGLCTHESCTLRQAYNIWGMAAVYKLLNYDVRAWSQSQQVQMMSSQMPQQTMGQSMAQMPGSQIAKNQQTSQQELSLGQRQQLQRKQESAQRGYSNAQGCQAQRSSLQVPQTSQPPGYLQSQRSVPHMPHVRAHLEQSKPFTQLNSTNQLQQSSSRTQNIPQSSNFMNQQNPQVPGHQRITPKIDQNQSLEYRNASQQRLAQKFHQTQAYPTQVQYHQPNNQLVGHHQLPHQSQITTAPNSRRQESPHTFSPSPLCPVHYPAQYSHMQSFPTSQTGHSTFQQSVPNHQPTSKPSSENGPVLCQRVMASEGVGMSNLTPISQVQAMVHSLYPRNSPGTHTAFVPSQKAANASSGAPMTSRMTPGHQVMSASSPRNSTAMPPVPQPPKKMSFPSGTVTIPYKAPSGVYTHNTLGMPPGVTGLAQNPKNTISSSGGIGIPHTAQESDVNMGVTERTGRILSNVGPAGVPQGRTRVPSSEELDMSHLFPGFENQTSIPVRTANTSRVSPAVRRPKITTPSSGGMSIPHKPVDSQTETFLSDSLRNSSGAVAGVVPRAPGGTLQNSSGVPRKVLLHPKTVVSSSGAETPQMASASHNPRISGGTQQNSGFPPRVVSQPGTRVPLSGAIEAHKIPGSQNHTRVPGGTPQSSSEVPPGVVLHHRAMVSSGTGTPQIPREPAGTAAPSAIQHTKMVSSSVRHETPAPGGSPVPRATTPTVIPRAVIISALKAIGIHVTDVSEYQGIVGELSSSEAPEDTPAVASVSSQKTGNSSSEMGMPGISAPVYQGSMEGASARKSPGTSAVVPEVVPPHTVGVVTSEGAESGNVPSHTSGSSSEVISRPASGPRHQGVMEGSASPRNSPLLLAIAPAAPSERRSASSAEVGISRITGKSGYQGGVIGSSGSPGLPAGVVPAVGSTLSISKDLMSSIPTGSTTSRWVGRPSDQSQCMASPKEAAMAPAPSPQAGEPTSIGSPRVLLTPLPPQLVNAKPHNEVASGKKLESIGSTLPAPGDHERTSTTVDTLNTEEYHPLDLSTTSSKASPRPEKSTGDIKPNVSVIKNCSLKEERMRWEEPVSPPEIELYVDESAPDSEISEKSSSSPVIYVVSDSSDSSESSSSEDEHEVSEAKKFKTHESEDYPTKLEINRGELEETDELEVVDQPKEFSLVDDEIECNGMAKEMGIYLESSCDPQFEEVPLKIAGVTSIPMDIWEGVVNDKDCNDGDDEREVDEKMVERLDDTPEEFIEIKPTLCIQCKEGLVIQQCRYCCEVLFCSRVCERNGSHHFAECPQRPPVVDIDD